MFVNIPYIYYGTQLCIVFCFIHLSEISFNKCIRCFNF